MTGSIVLIGSMTGLRSAVSIWSKAEPVAGSSAQPNWADADDNDKAVMMMADAFMLS